MSSPDQTAVPAERHHPFRRAVLRGLAVVLPPLLTIVIFVWIGNTINVYVLQPVQAGAREVLARAQINERTVAPQRNKPMPDTRTFDDIVYHVLPSNDPLANRVYIPLHVYKRVADNLAERESMPTTGLGAYRRYVELKYLRPQFVIPAFTSVFILLMYLLGKFLAAGVGHFAFRNFEALIHRLPIIRNVYGSVKQVTDFVFSESDVEYTRVVAFEYPRQGIWSLGLVTGESMLDIRGAANEPVLSVLVPTSPAPFTGFTITIKKSEAVDLNLTIDQAFQFIISCGVVVPAQQLQDHLAAEAAQADNNDYGETADEGGASAESGSALPATGS